MSSYELSFLLSCILQYCQSSPKILKIRGMALISHIIVSLSFFQLLFSFLFHFRFRLFFPISRTPQYVLWFSGPVKAFNSPNSTMIGTGLTPEGIDQNDMMYELMNEMGYRINVFNPVELEEWIKYYALRRYGNTNDNIVKAWKLLIHSVYNCTYYCIGFKHQSVFVRQPTLRIAPHIWYKPEDVFKAWDALISVAKDFSHSKTFR